MSATLRLTRAAFGAVQRASPRLAALWAARIFCTPPRRPISERMAGWLREANREAVRLAQPAGHPLADGTARGRAENARGPQRREAGGCPLHGAEGRSSQTEGCAHGD